MAAVLLGVTLVFAQSAFKASKTETSASGERWFVYTASDHPSDQVDAKEPTNYTMLDESSPPPCEGEKDLCAIKALPNGSLPDISGNVETAIDNYFDTVNPQVDPAYISEKN